MGGAAGLESLDLESAAPEDIIANVEKMLAQEQARDEQLKGDRKANTKQLDLTGAGSAGSAAAGQAAKGGQGADGAGMGRRQTTAVDPASVRELNSPMVPGASGESGPQTAEEEGFGAGVLDQGMSLIRRKTLAIKSDNVSDVVMSNIGAISESVAQFQKLTEESS